MIPDDHLDEEVGARSSSVFIDVGINAQMYPRAFRRPIFFHMLELTPSNLMEH